MTIAEIGLKHHIVILYIFVQAVLKAFHQGSSSDVDVNTAFPVFCDQSKRKAFIFVLTVVRIVHF